MYRFRRLVEGNKKGITGGTDLLAILKFAQHLADEGVVLLDQRNFLPVPQGLLHLSGTHDVDENQCQQTTGLVPLDASPTPGFLQRGRVLYWC